MLALGLQRICDQHKRHHRHIITHLLYVFERHWWLIEPKSGCKILSSQAEHLYAQLLQVADILIEK